MVDRNLPYRPAPDSPAELELRGVERAPVDMSIRDPSESQRLKMNEAAGIAAHCAEQRQVGERAAAEIRRQEGEAIRRDEREERYRERGY